MSAEQDTEACRGCNELITGSFCSNCGQPARLRKIDFHYIIHEISEFFFAKRGMIYTIKKVLIHPGDSVRDFISTDRSRFVKPITFLIITSLIYSLVNYIFNFGQAVYHSQTSIVEGTTTHLIIDWMYIKYPGYTGIITGLFIALWVRLFFRKSNYNIFEIFILLCFLGGITTLYISIVAIIQGVTHFNLLQPASYLGIIYTVWAIGQFFAPQKVMSYVKAFFSYILGALVLGMIVGIIGAFIDGV